jgi:hypothetical protein
MKKILLIFATLLLFRTSCEKEEKLSDLVIGEWYSQAVTIGSGEDALMVYFSAEFNSNGKYSLTFMDALEPNSPLFQIMDYIYLVGDGKISIENPTEPRNSGDPIMITFYVSVGDDHNTMTWTPEDSETDVPTLYWTREDH